MEQDYEILYETINSIVEVETMPTMLEKARVEGEVRGQAKAVLTTIQRKFKQIPKEIEEAVLARTDSIALESLLEHAIDSGTLDEFVDGLN